MKVKAKNLACFVAFITIFGILLVPSVSALDRTVSIGGTGEDIIIINPSIVRANGTNLSAYSNFVLQGNPNMTFRGGVENQNLTINSSGSQIVFLNKSFNADENVTFHKNGSVFNSTDDLSSEVTGDLWSIINQSHNISVANGSWINTTLRNNFVYINATTTAYNTNGPVRVIYNITPIANGTNVLQVTGLRRNSFWNYSINGTNIGRIQTDQTGRLSGIGNPESGIYVFTRGSDFLQDITDLQIFFDLIKTILIRLFVIVLVVEIVSIIFDTIASAISKPKRGP